MVSVKQEAVRENFKKAHVEAAKMRANGSTKKYSELLKEALDKMKK